MLWLKTNRLHCANFERLWNIILRQCWTTLSSSASLKSKQAAQWCDVKWFICHDSGAICGLLLLNIKLWWLWCWRSLTVIIIHLFSSLDKLVERAIYFTFRNFIYCYIVCKVICKIVNSISLVGYPKTN